MVREESLTTKDRLVVLGITLILFFGVFFIGKGVTGMYLIDFEQEYCEYDSDCIAEQVCCKFYKEDTGVCDKESNCKAIEQITKEEKEKISSSLYLEEEYEFTEEDKLAAVKTITSHLEKPIAPSNFPSILTGGILLILGVIWLIYLKRG